MAQRCEGYKRTGGAFTFGTPVWRRCESEATVMVTAEQDGTVSSFPVCHSCWSEAVERGITIVEATPILEDE